MRRVLVFAALIAGGIAAGVAYERRQARSRDWLDVYFDDGSFVTYVEGFSDADALLPLARDVFAAVQG